MSKPTGATEAQIVAASERWMPGNRDGDGPWTVLPLLRQAASALIPPDHRIVGPEGIDALRRVDLHGIVSEVGRGGGAGVGAEGVVSTLPDKELADAVEKFIALGHSLSWDKLAEFGITPMEFNRLHSIVNAIYGVPLHEATPEPTRHD